MRSIEASGNPMFALVFGAVAVFAGIYLLLDVDNFLSAQVQRSLKAAVRIRLLYLVSGIIMLIWGFVNIALQIRLRPIAIRWDDVARIVSGGVLMAVFFTLEGMSSEATPQESFAAKALRLFNRLVSIILIAAGGASLISAIKGWL